MRIVFMGTPEFAVPSLKLLVEAGHEIAACRHAAGPAEGPKENVNAASCEGSGASSRT